MSKNITSDGSLHMSSDSLILIREATMDNSLLSSLEELDPPKGSKIAACISFPSVQSFLDSGV